MSRLADLVEIANPQHPHCPVVLVLDTSGSMAEQGKIGQLAEGLAFFKEDVVKDELARKRVEIAVVTFGERVELAQDFASVDRFGPPGVRASGATPMGAALARAVELVEARKRAYREAGVDYYRPWIFLITDGAPTDMKPGDEAWSGVVRRLHEGEAERKFLFFAVGVEPADMALLGQLSPPERAPIRLQRGRFREMFAWISRSQQRVSSSRPGDEIALDNPLGPRGWGSI
jgi:uncharacterized protein YegL